MCLKPFSSLSDATVEVLDVRVYMVYTIAVSTVKRRREKKNSRLGPHSSSLDATLVVVAISEAYFIKEVIFWGGSSPIRRYRVLRWW